MVHTSFKSTAPSIITEGGIVAYRAITERVVAIGKSPSPTPIICAMSYIMRYHTIVKLADPHTGCASTPHTEPATH
jgi:hypothetical protein